MASPLFRCPWSILQRNKFQYNRFVAVASVNRNYETKSSSSYQQKSETFNKTVKHFLTCTILISGVSYVLYKWKNDFHIRFDNAATFWPVVHAKSLSPPNVNQNRNRYNFIADVVEISAPSVVYIEIKDHKRRDFFTGKPATVSNGSGFIVGQDGLILTNAHVVINKPNTSVKVRLHDGSVFTGTVEDVDTQSDLATVRINKTNLPVMKLGSSSTIRPGEFVVAIGSPLSLSNTITSGVVSSVNRQSTELGLFGKQMDYIQTDAAVNFGNSGGPLVNLDGEAIGINALKVTSGISFAIPIDYAKDFLQKTEMRRKGKGIQNTLDMSKRRYLGITMLTLTPDILFEMQRNGGISYAIKHGVLVWKIVAGSPAHMGGLQPGDVITHVNDEPVVAAVNIYKELEKAGVLNLIVVRKGDVLHMAIEPEEV